MRAGVTDLFFTLTVKNVFAQLFLGWELTQRQLVLIRQTDAIAAQLQLDHEPVEGEGIFSSLYLNCLCWTQDPQRRNPALTIAILGSC